MNRIIVGIKETHPNVWRLTYNGYILGDSRGYNKAKAKLEALALNGKETGDWHGSKWVPAVYYTDLKALRNL